MDLAAFEDLLDRYGGDLESWPSVHSKAATAFLATSSSAGRALDAMRMAEQVLRSTREVGAGGRVDAVAAASMRHRQQGASRRLALRAGLGAAAAALLVLGVSVGSVAASQHDDSPERLMAVSLDPPGSTDVD